MVGGLFSADVALWTCGGLFSDLLNENARLCEGLGEEGGGWSERLGSRFPCLGEQGCVCV